MMVMQLTCPVCHHASGNTLTCDWPEPMDGRRYENLICAECGREFAFQIDPRGMITFTRHPGVELVDFLNRRRRSRRSAHPR